ncbi:MAG: hypothetical protein Q8S09_06410, partial [Hyphomonas sp.]|nr:hypothetical protein [Hyphomonas sp.]
IFGTFFPAPAEEVEKAFVFEGAHHTRNTEEFIEDRFPVDIRFDMQIDCKVSQDGFQPSFLREMLAKRFPLRPNKRLEFTVARHTVPGEFELYWKVLNRGVEAVKRNCIRGQIVPDAGQMQKSETTDFNGDHIVECFAVKNGVVVAKDRIRVPIQG